MELCQQNIVDVLSLSTLQVEGQILSSDCTIHTLFGACCCCRVACWFWRKDIETMTVLLSTRVVQKTKTAVGRFDNMLGKYRLGKVLGTGFSGVVWQGRNVLTNEDVVVKQVMQKPLSNVGVRDSLFV